MSLAIINKMLERVDNARNESDAALFQSLLLLGEVICKTATIGIVSGLEDDVDRYHYQQLYRLVRSDGIGDWADVLETTLSGPASQYLCTEIEAERRELTQRSGPNEWQYEASVLINKCLQLIVPSHSDLASKINGKRWFHLFAQLRNKTRGHGATKSQVARQISVHLEKSIRMIIENFCLFRREWAYVRLNVSGRYSIIPMTQSCLKFSSLNKSEKLEEGIYIYYGKPCRVDLIQSSVDLDDFYFPNGGYTGDFFEALSYISDRRIQTDASDYRTPITTLPASETEGSDTLDVQGKVFTNLPIAPKNYIQRVKLENELKKVLIDDRHPVITLSGRGGIGKTTLALSTLYELFLSDVFNFEAVVWFSARDIDLLAEGPKHVRPNILNEKDVAKDFVKFMKPAAQDDKGFNSLDYLTNFLRHSDIGPILFVFDNFETVASPHDFFEWLNTYIRLPNKILITTRVRQFKADYPIEVEGMEDDECYKLIDNLCDDLGITSLVNKNYHQNLLLEADGHPYVIKILLGEVAKAKKLIKIERIVATKDKILDALFERTFNSLSPVAQRVFLTLCNWRTILPQLAIEAVLLRPENDKMDVTRGIEELQISSFIEIALSERDEMAFVSVPLVASVFGRRKLSVSPYKSAIEADTQILHYFGAAGQIDIKHGIGPRIVRMFNHIRERIENGQEQVKDFLPIIEFIARQYPIAWLDLAELYQITGSKQDFKEAQSAIKCYLENDLDEKDKQLGWKQLTYLCKRNDYYIGEAQALVEGCKLSCTPFYDISDAAVRITYLLKSNALVLDTDHMHVLVRQLTDVVENRIIEADATSCSRLAWLYYLLRDHDGRDESIIRGLKLDPKNEYCKRLAERFLIRH